MDFHREAENLVKQMTLEEKASLCSGEGFWNLKKIERLGIPTIMLSDGPHGLRKQEQGCDHIGLNTSVEATCYPTASCIACSFDPELLYQVGNTIGEEASEQGISVVLGPGVNQKRNPLCGRNFEYFSEDPLLSGELAASWIKGIQEKHVGASLKHFAANNQETKRMCINAVVDERALREIYLRPFEIAIKKSNPFTVMCAYNRLNGEYASENHELMTKILREEWGFQGSVVTDWGAICDRVKGLEAGIDLEMPAAGTVHDCEIVSAVKNGEIPEQILNTTATRITELILRTYQSKRNPSTYSAEKSHALAVRAVEESAVLLKNKYSLLPLDVHKQSVALIGAFAKYPRYQGAGSSKVNAKDLVTPYEALEKMGASFQYVPGYSLEDPDQIATEYIEEACQAACSKDVAILFIGLPESYESEGYDRESLSLPPSHLKLVDEVARVSKKTVVILMGGAPMELPFEEDVSAILLTYLAGEGVGEGIANLIFGKTSPSGKLAETFPLNKESVPSNPYFPGDGMNVEYRESIFSGYRYYVTAHSKVRYPFGYGLTYTTFEYSDLTVKSRGKYDIELTCTISNTGAVDAKEIVQLYIGHPNAQFPYAAVELRGFKKVYVPAGTSKTISFTLSKNEFEYFNIFEKRWVVDGGEYTLSIGPNCMELPLSANIQICGDVVSQKPLPLDSYMNLNMHSFGVSDADFKSLLGEKNKYSTATYPPYTIRNTLGEFAEIEGSGDVIKKIYDQSLKMAEGSTDLQEMCKKTFHYMPIRTLPIMLGASATPERVYTMVDAFNKKDFDTIAKILDVIEEETHNESGSIKS